MYALVEFPKDNSVSVVPYIWLKEDHCLWPNVKDVSRLAKAMQNPASDWTLYKVYIKALYATYDEAKRNEQKFQYSSNLESTDDENLGKGKRNMKRVCEQESADESDSDIIYSSVPEQAQQSRLVFPAVPTFNKRLKEAEPTPECSFTLSTENITSPPKEYEVIANGPQASDSGTKNDTFMSKILKEVLYIKLVLKEQGEIISTILSSLNAVHDRLPAGGVIVNNRSLPVNLPLDSLEDLTILEEALNEDELQEYLCEKLSQVGGTSLGNAVRRMLTKMMTNKLAISFSWVGIKGKEPFASLRIASVLINAVRRNPTFALSSDSDIEIAIKDWLRHAKARTKG